MAENTFMTDSLAADLAVLKRQYKDIPWNTESGLSPDALRQACQTIEQENPLASRLTIKAKQFAFLMENAQVCVRPEDWFADMLHCENLLDSLRGNWHREIEQNAMAPVLAECHTHDNDGSHTGECDFGHTIPDWDTVMRLGFPGLFQRICDAKKEKQDAGTLTAEQEEFYNASEMVYRAVLRYVNRLADEADSHAAKSAKMPMVAHCLRNLATRAPQNTLEAMQLSFLYYYLQNMVEGEPLRSLGGLDALFFPYWQADLAEGRFTEEQLREFLQYFLIKYGAVDNSANIPFFLGGVDRDGNNMCNALTEEIIQVYDTLNLISPKIQFRWHPGVSDSVVRLVLKAIVHGNNSFVFINDEVVIPALTALGEDLRDARYYAPIGCYEPAAIGKEIPCTCNGIINLPKAVELVLHNGMDPMTGKQSGLSFADYPFADFDAFYAAVKQQLSLWAEESMRSISAWETHYMQINPSPLYSATLDECVARGADVYAGGAKYNNSSINCISPATAVDALTAVRKLVYEEKAISLPELSAVLASNWADHEDLRLRCLNLGGKYGNGDPETDRLAANLLAFMGSCINRQPNGRGGVFRCGAFSIDWCWPYGQKTGATPDGRFAGDVLSKNMCATLSQDKKGLTALIRSVTEIDFTNTPNGTVLDVMFHPSAVSGEEGLTAMLAVLKTYLKRGGFAIHFNVMDPKVLRKAQEDPDSYRNLQVRVCGWNAYFTNLNRDSQDAFILQAETVS